MSLERDLAAYGERVWSKLEQSRIIETSSKLREYGYQFTIQAGMKPTYIAGISMVLPHSTFEVLYRPPTTAIRPPELVIREVEEKYYERWLDSLGNEMVRVGWEITLEGLRSLGKMLFLSPQTMIGD
jgi:hypothetical protein